MVSRLPNLGPCFFFSLTNRMSFFGGISEACEMWLHGRCTKITRREMPPVYICAFCANTPNMRGGRLRDTGRAGSSNVAMGSGMPSSSHGHGHGHGTSPLAHKSFKSFR